MFQKENVGSERRCECLRCRPCAKSQKSYTSSMSPALAIDHDPTLKTFGGSFKEEWPSASVFSDAILLQISLGWTELTRSAFQVRNACFVHDESCQE